MFLSANAGKRSLALSLRDPRGREALLRLVDGADVFLQSLRPGLAEELGLGAGGAARAQPAARLLLRRRVRPRGPAAPRARLRRADAGSGRAHLDHRRARPARRPGRLVADRPGHRDLGGARHPRRAARARAAPARAPWSTSRSTRRRSATSATTSWASSPTAPSRTARARGSRWSRPYQVFPTRDGELMIAGGNDRLFAAICGVVGSAGARRRPPLRARTPTGCATATSSPRSSRTRCREHDTEHWLERLTEAGVPAAPVADIAEVARAPQTEALGIMQRSPIPHPRPQAPGAAALVRRRARAAPVGATRGRRAHRRDTARAGLRRRRNRGACRRRSDQSDEPRLGVVQRHDPRPPLGCARLVRTTREAIGEAGGSLGAIDLVRVERAPKVRDVTVDAADADHLERIVERVRRSTASRSSGSPTARS